MVAVEWSRGIEDGWSKVATFVPKFIAFLAILVIGWFVAKAIARAADKVLERVGFDRAVERGGIRRVLARSKCDASDVVAKIISYALILLVLQLAFGVWGPNPVSDLLEGVIAYLPKVIAAILVIVVASAVGAAARELIQVALGGLSYGQLLANIAAGAITTVGVFMALNPLQIAPAIVNGLFYSLLAVIVGSAIVAIGGGGIAPMRHRWENVLNHYDNEKPRVRRQLDGAGERIKVHTQLRAEQAARAATNMQTNRRR